MPKFSIIIPVYNVEKYIKKCLESVFNQTYSDYEVIVVNDGTKDKSMDIVNEYNVKIINQKNMGLSEARNNGVKKATGEYIIFLDGDDYIEKDLLKIISENLDNDPDILRYQAKDIANDDEIKRKEVGFYGKDGHAAFEIISTYHYVEPAWLYAIKRKYYNDNKFKFKKNTYHEDFGIIPLVILKSSTVNSIDYCGYCYVQRSGSIMNNANYEKTIKKTQDIIDHYNFLINEASKLENINIKYFNSFISNSVILKITELKRKEYKKYLKILKDKKIFDNILDDTLGRKIKKFLLKLSPKVYYKIKGKN